MYAGGSATAGVSATTFVSDTTFAISSRTGMDAAVVRDLSEIPSRFTKYVSK